MNKVLIFSNYGWTIYNFRLPLIRHLIAEGYRVSILSKGDAYYERLCNIDNLECHELKLNRVGKNPFQEIASIYSIYKCIKQINPDVILTFTIKPNLYTGLLNIILKKKVIANITGIGEMRTSSLFPLIKMLYSLALSKVHKVFFQNNEDLIYFTKNGLVSKDKCTRIPGSGIGLGDYTPDYNYKFGKKIFLMAARMLPQKGFYEFVEAIKTLNINNPHIQFHIYGALQEDRPESVALHEYLKKSSYVKYFGYTDDIKRCIKEAYFIVLPSYYNEGVPRILIEAIAMGKPIITTKQKGCKDVFSDNGYLIAPKSVNALGTAIRCAIDLSEHEYLRYCENSRILAVDVFDERKVFSMYQCAIDNQIDMLNQTEVLQ